MTQGDSWDKGPRFHHRAQHIVIEPLLGIVSTVHPEPASCPRCGNTPRFRNLEAKEAKVAMRKLVSSKSPLDRESAFHEPSGSGKSLLSQALRRSRQTEA